VYPYRDNNGESTHLHFVVGLQQYEEMRELYNEGKATGKMSFETFADYERYGMLLALQYGREKLKGTASSSPTMDREALRKRNDAIERDVGMLKELERTRDSLKAVERQEGEEGVRNVLRDIVRMVDGMGLEGERVRCLEYIEVNFSYWLERV